MFHRAMKWVRPNQGKTLLLVVILVALVSIDSRTADSAVTASHSTANHTGRWSPYVVGLGIGILSCLSFVISNRPIGVSTAYAQTSGLIGRVVVGSRIDEMPYYRMVRPEIGWEWMLAVGVLLGGCISAVLSGDIRFEPAPPLWVREFGPGVAWRWFVAGMGGFFSWVWGRGGRAAAPVGTASAALSNWSRQPKPQADGITG